MREWLTTLRGPRWTSLLVPVVVLGGFALPMLGGLAVGWSVPGSRLWVYLASAPVAVACAAVFITAVRILLREPAEHRAEDEAPTPPQRPKRRWPQRAWLVGMAFLVVSGMARDPVTTLLTLGGGAVGLGLLSALNPPSEGLLGRLTRGLRPTGPAKPSRPSRAGSRTRRPRVPRR
ncbi:hypothetical protein AB0I28_29070 [Phytomonospora sp. NPDC050363]|uniref:hypothetical protein n=1 Tax=Phytomonospora sp. NPDC050363 TaxID=3155642 RepID=UPI0033E3C228